MKILPALQKARDATPRRGGNSSAYSRCHSGAVPFRGPACPASIGHEALQWKEQLRSKLYIAFPLFNAIIKSCDFSLKPHGAGAPCSLRWLSPCLAQHCPPPVVRSGPATGGGENHDTFTLILGKKTKIPKENKKNPIVSPHVQIALMS